ncbi:hypothetical protein NKG94_28895 [Micromonospora sp. M12]
MSGAADTVPSAAGFTASSTITASVGLGWASASSTTTESATE